MALSTNQKIAIAVGVTVAVVLIGAAAFTAPKKQAIVPPPRPQGLHFDTRNLDALDAVVAAMVADPKLTPATLGIFADQLSYYGLYAQELRLRQKINPQLQMQLVTTAVSGGLLTLRQAMAKK